MTANYKVFTSTGNVVRFATKAALCALAESVIGHKPSYSHGQDWGDTEGV